MFNALDKISPDIITIPETQEHNRLRKELLVENAIEKYGSIDDGINEIRALLITISKKVGNDKVTKDDKADFNKLLTILNIKNVSPTITNSYVKRIIAENLGLINTSLNKLEEKSKTIHMPPPDKPNQKFGSTVQSIQSNDTSPVNYPIDVSSNVSR